MTLPLTHASFFTGIGGFDLGLERAGFTTLSHSEVKPYSCAVLATRWPDVPNLGDLNALCPDGEGEHDCIIPRATVWSGGFPCSDFSTMGQRKGLLGGNRSSLGLVFLDLVRRHRPPFFVLENVPGLLTSHEGRDLGQLLGIVGDLGYGWSFRLLDARDFGLPQGRRRLFVVAAADPRDAGAVLDDSTDRGLDHTAFAAAGGPGLAGGARRADSDDRVVLGPTYAPGQQRRNTAFPITPSNHQYVFDDPVLVVRRVGFSGAFARQDGASYTVMPGANDSDAQYIFDEPVDVERSGWRLGDVGRDGAGDGAIGDDGDRPLRGRAAEAAPGDRRETDDWIIPGSSPAASDADGVRALAGLPGRLDDRVRLGDEDLGPKHLDLARWHVVGRSVPVPIVAWIGLGLRSVIEAKESRDGNTDGAGSRAAEVAG